MTIPTVPASRFTQVGDRFVAEISDFYDIPNIGRGFYVASERADFPVHFVPARAVRDSSGDVTRWEFKSADPAVAITVVIYND